MANLSISQNFEEFSEGLSHSEVDYTTSEEHNPIHPPKKIRRSNRKRDNSDLSQPRDSVQKTSTTKVMLDNILSSITEVSTKVDSLVSKVKLVEDTLGAVVTKSDNISINLSKLKSEVELKFQNHDGRLTQVEAQVQSIVEST
jgi:hypothetical protein